MKKDKSKKAVITIAIIGYIILYILIKLIIVYCQDLYMSNEIYENEYGIGKLLKITKYTNEQRLETNYFENKNSNYKIKIKNYFDKFEQGEYDNDYEYYMLYNEDDKVEAAFMMGKTNTQIENIKNGYKDTPYYEFNYFPLYISKYSRIRFLSKHKINDDVALIKYLRQRKKIDPTFTTPLLSIKENYFFNYIEASQTNLESVTYIEGDYYGYIKEYENNKQVIIIKDDNAYYLTFYNLSYFSEEKIKDILESLLIEK